jgi:hypothetical protein
MADETSPFLPPDPVAEPPAPHMDLLSEPAEPVTARTRLRDFEDDHLGEDAVRISGQIEKGHGSHFQTRMTHEQRVQHTALEKLVEAEKRVADTSAALASAEADHEAAKKHVEACAAASKTADAERERKAAEAKARHDKRESELSGSEQHA